MLPSIGHSYKLSTQRLQNSHPQIKNNTGIPVYSFHGPVQSPDPSNSDFFNEKGTQFPLIPSARLTKPSRSSTNPSRSSITWLCQIRHDGSFWGRRYASCRGLDLLSHLGHFTTGATLFLEGIHGELVTETTGASITQAWEVGFG